MPGETLTRAERTRLEIVRAAHDLFVQQGYHGTSMRQIAKEAGVALGGLYNHFDGKEQVFKVVFFEYHPYHEVLPAVLALDGENVERLVRDAVRRMIRALEARPDFMNLIFIEVVEFNSRHTRELFAEILPQLMLLLERVLLADRRRLRDIPPLMLLRLFFAQIFGYFLSQNLFSLHADPEFCEGAAEHFSEVFLHGVLRDGVEAAG